MNKLLQGFYHGRIPIVSTTQSEEIRKKIRSERRYFLSRLSAKDRERYKNLEALHTESHARRYENTYAEAFKLGAMLMLAIFAESEDK